MEPLCSVDPGCSQLTLPIFSYVNTRRGRFSLLALLPAINVSYSPSYYKSCSRKYTKIWKKVMYTIALYKYIQMGNRWDLCPVSQIHWALDNDGLGEMIRDMYFTRKCNPFSRKISWDRISPFQHMLCS